MQIQEGTRFTTVQRSKKSSPVMETEGTGEIAVQAGSAMNVTASAGRTISLGNFEFARVTVRLSAAIERDQFASLQEVANSVVETEERVLKGGEGSASDIGDIPGTDRSISIEYGMTISLKRYESAKVDVGITQPISDDDDFATKLTEIQEWVASRLQEEVEKVKPGGDVGL